MLASSSILFTCSRRVDSRSRSDRIGKEPGGGGAAGGGLAIAVTAIGAGLLDIIINLQIAFWRWA